MEPPSFLECLPLSTLQNHVFLFLTKLGELLQVANTNKYLRRAVISSDLWRYESVDICLDRECFGCGRYPIYSTIAWNIIAYTNMEFLRIHLPYTRLESCANVMLHSRTLRSAHLRFRFDGSTFSDQLIHSHSKDSCLESLTIFGWPKVGNRATGQRLPSCHNLFRLFGSSLKSIKFKESCPQDIFESILSFANQLNSVEVEGQLNSMALQNFTSETIVFLSLIDSKCKLDFPLRLPSLQKFEYLNKSANSNLWESVTDVLNAISSIPSTVTDLNFSVASEYGNQFIAAVGKRFPVLERLSVSLSDNESSAGANAIVPADINSLSMSNLCANCQSLRCVEISGGIVGVDLAAFKLLAHLPLLRRVILLYNEEIVNELPHTLNSGSNLEEIIFFENAGEIMSENGNTNRWEQMEDAINDLAELFPALSIRLDDYGWA